MGLIFEVVMNQESTVLSIQDFCKQHQISRNHLYTLWAHGEGPVVMRVGRRRLITVEAAAEWRKRMEESHAAGHSLQADGVR